MLGGIVWILLLPLNRYSRQTYISENALLPGQVHTYFGGSEQNVFRAYRNELNELPLPVHLNGENETLAQAASAIDRSLKIQDLFHNAGLTKIARQSYTYKSSGETYQGENVYAILQAPRGDGTEAIVLVAALRNIENQDNINGVPLLLSLARYFKRWSLWSKDIIFLVTEDSKAGPQAWIDAYHSEHDETQVSGLPLKSGALQGAVCIDYPFGHAFETVHIAYDGINGQLPNLDLVNTAVSIASGQMNIGASIQHMYKHDDSYVIRLQTLLLGMVSQAIGHATGPHSVFIPYHVDAITLTAIGEGVQDEMALGRTVESLCRSLNNLLEHLHQSFFFYLLMQTNRFVSIGTYLPSAMAVAAGYTIISLWLWFKVYTQASGSVAQTGDGDSHTQGKQEKKEQTTVLDRAAQLTDKLNANTLRESSNSTNALVVPLGIAVVLHIILPVVPIYLVTQLTAPALFQSFFVLSLFSLLLPIIIASALPEMAHQDRVPFLRFPPLNNQQYLLLRSLSLLWTGACLTVLATLNFSLSIFLGISGMPVVLCSRDPGRPGFAGFQYLILVLFSPMALAVAGIAYLALTAAAGGPGVEQGVQEALSRIAFGWNVWSSWGIIVGVWCIWWPAWIAAAVSVASSWYSTAESAPGTTAVPKTPPIDQKTGQNRFSSSKKTNQAKKND